MTNIKQSFRRFFTDKHDTIAVVQFPNLPLIMWLLATGITHIVRSGFIHTSARVVAATSLLIWAVLEVASGVSPFRRVLGGIVLLLMFISLRRIF